MFRFPLLLAFLLLQMLRSHFHSMPTPPKFQIQIFSGDHFNNFHCRNCTPVIYISIKRDILCFVQWAIQQHQDTSPEHVDDTALYKNRIVGKENFIACALIDLTLLHNEPDPEEQSSSTSFCRPLLFHSIFHFLEAMHTVSHNVRTIFLQK